MTEEMEKNFKDLEELYKLGMLDAEGYAFQKKQLEDALQGAASSGVDEQSLRGVAHNDSLQDEQRREGFIPSSAPSADYTMMTTIQQEAQPPLPQMPKIRVSIGGKEIGAFEREEVIKKIRSGEIRSDARVFKDGMPDWVNAGNLPELEDHFDRAQEMYEEGMRYKKESWDIDLYGRGDKAKVEPYRAKYRELIIKAAEMGNAKAQEEVAGEYFSSVNIYFPQDKAKAVYWWTKAAEQGDPRSCWELGSLYSSGESVTQDLERAEELLNKAIVGGNNEAWVKGAKKHLKEVEKLLGKRGLFGKKK